MRLLGQFITKKPVVISFIFLLVLVGLVTGATRMKLATGNETLMSTDSDVYKDNQKLEEFFGGETIIVLNTSTDNNGILTVDNFNRMKELEQSLQHYEEIYTFISPASIVEQLTNKQAEMILERITEMQDGLNEMGTRLIDIGVNIEEKSSTASAPDFDSILNSFSEMNNAFTKMIQGQEKLSGGVQQLNKGYTDFAVGMDEVAVRMVDLGSLLTAVEKDAQITNPDVMKNMKQSQMMTSQLSEKMKELAEKMRYVSSETAPLVEVPAQTATGMTKMQQGLNQKIEELGSSNTMSSLKDDLAQLADGITQMGEKLIEISDGLGTVLSYSDIMHPGLPSTQSTLDNLLYEDGSLRPIFDELILDANHSIMMIKLKGNANDAIKEEVATAIKERLELQPFTGVDTIVTGKPVMDSAVRSSMQESMQKMIVIAIGIMMAVLLIVFPVRWRILPIPVILLAVIATLGLMGYVSVPMTMVSMAVFPILIGLGVDYAIQFQNRYEEELAKEEILDV